MYTYDLEHAEWKEVSPDKYTIQSGVDIKAEGVEITGSKYIRMKSASGVASPWHWEFNNKGVHGAFQDYLYEIGTPDTTLEDNYNTVIKNCKSDGNGIPYGNGYSYVGGVKWEVLNKHSGVTNTLKLVYDIGMIELASGNREYMAALYSDNSTWGTILGTRQRPWLDTFTHNVHAEALVMIGGNSTMAGDLYIYDAANNLDIFMEADNRATFNVPIYGTIAGSSSRDVKKDIKDVEDVGDKLDKLRPVSFVYKNKKDKKTHFGLIHEETYDIMPEICVGDHDTDPEDKAICYTDLVPILLKEVQELRKRVATLEEKVNELERE